MSASSESAAQAVAVVRGCEGRGHLAAPLPAQHSRPRGGPLTGVDEKLVGDPGVVHVMDGSRKESSKNLQVREHRLGAEREGQKDEDQTKEPGPREMGLGSSGARWCSRPGQVWPAARGWTGARQPRAGCCGRPHRGGSGPLGSAYTS